MRSPSIDQTRTILKNNTFSKKLNVPTSKSRANRMLFLAAIDPNPTHLKNMPQSSDVIDMMNSLKIIGLKIQKISESEIIVENSFPKCEENTVGEEIVVECGYGGTTTRFLAGLVSLGRKHYNLEPAGHMRERPMDEIIKPLELLGIDIRLKSENAWLSIKGPVSRKLSKIEVDTSRSTQFASAIMMLASSWEGEVVPINMKASEQYFKMTVDCIEQAKKNNWNIPIDFSSLSYPLALAAVCGEVEILNYGQRDFFQPDSVFIDILKEMGALVLEQDSKLIVENIGQLKPWSGDCSGFPDLVPTLAFVNSFTNTNSTLSGVEVLKYKESDRIDEIIKILKLYNIESSQSEGEIMINPQNLKSSRARYNAPDDHRMIMVCALFMRMLGEGEISNWDHVKKSFPHFFEDVIEE